MSIRDEYDPENLYGSLDIEDTLAGTCCARMIFGLGGADNDSYNSFDNFKSDLKKLYLECSAGAKFFFCFTNDEQDQERDYLKTLGFTTMPIGDTDMYVSTIPQKDLGLALKPKIIRRFRKKKV